MVVVFLRGNEYPAYVADLDQLFVAINEIDLEGPLLRIRQMLEIVADRKDSDDKTVRSYERLVHQGHAASHLKLAAGKIQWQVIAKTEAQAQALELILTADHLLSHGETIRIKRCHGEWCPVLFYDFSKNRSRKWCDMSHCGMLRKSRKYYDKHRRAK